MYKTAGGKIRFSFSRFVTNAVPNFANDGNADDANISPKQQDDLFAYQMRLDNPKIFDDLSLFACGIVGKSTSCFMVFGLMARIRWCRNMQETQVEDWHVP